jgi:hypothetical protein
LYSGGGERNLIMGGNAQERNALDLLEDEDLELLEIFYLLEENRGGTVEQRANYGDLAKEAVKHTAIREAALVEVAEVAGEIVELQGVAERLEKGAVVRRSQFDNVEKMSRGVPGINLNMGQDFDSELVSLSSILEPEVTWDLKEAIPKMREAVAHHDCAGDLKSARYVQHHAPTNLRPQHARRVERAPVISRIITIYDRLRDFPKHSRPRRLQVVGPQHNDALQSQNSRLK